MNDVKYGKIKVQNNIIVRAEDDPGKAEACSRY
jgi:hypothetical protein